MEERNQTIATELKRNKRELLGENDISNIFTIAQEETDFSFIHSFNVIGASNQYHYGIDSGDAVVFATITKAIRNAKLSGKPILFIVDEVYFFIEKWWFKDLVLEQFNNVENVDIKITSQSLMDVKHHLPIVLEKANQITLFRTSIRDLQYLKQEYHLSDEEVNRCNLLGVNETFVILRGNKKEETKYRRIDKKVYIEKRKFHWNLKRLLIKFTHRNAGHCERMCLAAGYSKDEINKMVENTIKDGWVDKNDSNVREEVCQIEVSNKFEQFISQNYKNSN
jgi:hypothetical protein